MNVYQKAIKVRKICETQPVCKDCPYYDKCSNSVNLLFLHPIFEDIEVLAKAIKEEKWNVK